MANILYNSVRRKSLNKYYNSSLFAMNKESKNISTSVFAQCDASDSKHQKEQNEAETNKETQEEIALMFKPQTRAD